MSKIISQYRVCTSCKLEKHISEFHKMQKRGRIESRSKCILCEREDGRIWAKSNKEVISAKNKRYYSLNTEKEAIRRKTYAQQNHEKARLNAKKFRMLNPEKKKFWDRRWYQNNRVQALLNGQVRRARIKGNGGKITRDEWVKLCEEYNNTCLWCGRSDVPMTLDHIIPISLGGRNVIENAQPLCKSCNSKKHTKIIDYRGDKYD